MARRRIATMASGFRCFRDVDVFNARLVGGVVRVQNTHTNKECRVFVRVPGWVGAVSVLFIWGGGRRNT